MNRQAMRNLLYGTQAKIKMIDADLRAMNGPWTEDKMWSQGYQTGRKAELESLATTLEIALAVAGSAA